jgi:metal-responsive CopG/Arc/MetJ family transcriptional regulator
MAKNTTRISMTIPTELSENLNSISHTLRISRSSLITEILNDSVPLLTELLDSMAMLTSKPDSKEPLSRNYDLVRTYLDSIKASVDSNSQKFTETHSEFQHLLEGLEDESKH